MQITRGIILALFLFSALAIGCAPARAAGPVGAALEDSLRAAKTKFDRTEMLIGAARETAKADSAGALALLKRAAKTAKGDPLAEANAADARGLFYYERDDFASSIAWYELSADLLQKAKFEEKTDRLSGLLNHLGKIYTRIGANDEAIKTTLEAARIAREGGATGWEAYACVNLGTQFYREGNYAKARDYYERGERMARENNDPHKVSGALNGLGQVLMKEKDNAAACEAFAKARAIADSLYNAEGHKNMLALDKATFQQNMARALIAQAKYDQAGQLLQNGLRFLAGAKVKRVGSYIDHHLALGELYRITTDFKEARAHFRKALALVRENDIRGFLPYALSEYAKLLEITGPAEELNAVYREYISLRDDIVSETRQTAILETEARYNVKAKIDEINSLRAESEAERKLNIALAAVAVVLLAGAVYVWFSRKRLARAHRKLRELTRFREQFVGMLVHDLKNPLNAVLGLSASTEIVRHRKAIRQAARQMLNLTLNLLDVQKFEDAGLKPDLKPVLLEELEAEALEQTAFLAESNGVDVTAETDAGVALDAEPELLTRVLVNLLTNAVKYADSQARLRTRIIAGKIVISIEDDGPGVPKAHREAIFEAFSQFDSRGAGAAKSTGVGLTFCKLAVEAHGGDIRAEASNDLGGAAFVIELPPAQQGSVPERSPAAKRKRETAKPEKAPVLAEAERDLLANTARKLAAFEVYEISEITDALEPLREHAHPGVREWAAQLENAALNIDEDAYRKFLRRAEPSLCHSRGDKS